MLSIFNRLGPFFEDCYQRIHVREYAKLRGLSPPTASKLLSGYEREGLLLKEKERGYILFHANREDDVFVDLSRIYWRQRLEAVVRVMEKTLADPAIVLFGSLAKVEAKSDSDVDLAVFAERREIDLAFAEKKLKRNIQVHWFRSLHEVNRELANNILNGHVIRGRLSL